MKAFALTLVAFLAAVTSSRSQAIPEREPSSPVFELEEVIVFAHAEPLSFRTSIQPPAMPVDRSSIAEALAALPGLSGQRRGSGSFEPNIRGLGFDRVRTSVDGMELINASPTRTASPLEQLGGLVPAEIRVSRVMPSVKSGPAVTGGSISLSFMPAPGLEHSWAGFVDLNLDEDRAGWVLRSVFDGGTASLSWRATAYGQDLGDYQSGDVTVSAQDRRAGAAVGMRIRLSDATDLGFSAFMSRLDEVANVTLPLDTFDSNAWGGSLEFANWSGSGVIVTASVSQAQPELSNQSRPGVPVLIRMVGEASTSKLGIRWEGAENGHELALGLALQQEERNGERFRGSAVDRIWPDVRDLFAGAFVDWHHNATDTLQFHLGLRVDWREVEAREAGALAFGRSLSDWWSQYSGTGANEREEWTWLLNAWLVNRRGPWELYAGAGAARQGPGTLERYRGMLTALGGGWELGNPGLKPELKLEGVAGARMTGEALRLEFEIFAATIEDFITRQVVGETVGPLPPGQVVFSHRNIDATAYGAEIRGTWRPLDRLHLPFTLAWTEMENRSNGRGLPDVPPLEFNLALQYYLELESRWFPAWWRLDARFVESKENPDPMAVPILAGSDSISVFDFRLHWNVSQIGLDLAVRNLFDAVYEDYLSLPSGPFPREGSNLPPNVRVPAPGRTFVLSARYAW